MAAALSSQSIPDGLVAVVQAWTGWVAAERGLKVVEFHDWKKIDEAEVARAREDSPREKFVRLDDMIGAAGKR